MDFHKKLAHSFTCINACLWPFLVLTPKLSSLPISAVIFVYVPCKSNYYVYGKISPKEE